MDDDVREDDMRDDDRGERVDMADDRRDDGGTNWLPILLIPLAFLAGWGIKGSVDQTQNTSQNQQNGVGGGPGTPDRVFSTDTPVPTVYQFNSPAVTPTDTPSLLPSGSTGQ